jgi:AraC family transcriptional regulator of adaptative response/methylated-DNA-[protein]-cysteine methyltransferase
MIKALEQNPMAMFDGRALLYQHLQDGLSSCPQLHPFLVQIKPTEYNTVEETLYLSSFNTPFSPMFICRNQGGEVYSLEFSNANLDFKTWAEELKSLLPKAHWVEQTNAADDFARALFPEHAKPIRPTQPLSVRIETTLFQQQIWNLLLHLPAGHITKYRDLADYNGTPNASRAVGTALGQNRVAYLIPCHRVLSTRGLNTGFRWGAALKEALLDWEFEHTNAK